MKKFLLLSCFTMFTLLPYAQENEETRQIMKLYNQANAALEMNYVNDAIAKLKEITELAPQFPEAYLMLGNAYSKNQNDASSIENAIGALKKYLSLKPNAPNAEEVRTSIDKLEFLSEKLFQKEEQKDYMNGRWASALNDDKKSLFIFDVTQIGGKIKIDIEPSSAAYSDNFVSKTAYAEPTNDGGYTFYFTDDKTYIPSQAGYDFNRAFINQSGIGSKLGGSGMGGWGVDAALNYFNNKAQEKDIANNTRKTYEFKITPNNNKLECIIRFVHKTSSQQGEKILLDDMFVLDFYKVEQSHVNTEEIILLGNAIYLKDSKARLEEKEKTGNIKIMEAVRLDLDNQKAAENALKQNPEAYKLYKQGRRKEGWAAAMIGVGTTGTILGIILEIVAKNSSEYESLQGVGIMTAVPSAIMLFGGIPLNSQGRKTQKHALELYNQSIKRTLGMHLNFGVSNNGLAMSLNF